MIDLAALGDLAADLPEGGLPPVADLELGERAFDTDATPVLMGVVNLSRDSTYRESVAPGAEAAVRRARILTAQGAHFVDLGAEASDASRSRSSAGQQLDQLLPVITELSAQGIATSVESYDLDVVAGALEAGAVVVNLTGSEHDDEVFDLAAKHRATVLLCHVAGAHARALADRPTSPGSTVELIAAMAETFELRVANARERGADRLILDPGIGFGLPAASTAEDRVVLQGSVILNSFRLRSLGLPICQSLPHAFAIYEDEFRSAESLFAVLALIAGVGVLRTHEVPQIRAVARTLQLLRPQIR